LRDLFKAADAASRGRDAAATASLRARGGALREGRGRCHTRRALTVEADRSVAAARRRHVKGGANRVAVIDKEQHADP
jgi:hypothetical protein